MEDMNTATKKYQKGELIFKQGEYASCMYDISQGKVGIIANYGEDSEKTLTELEEGASFGEMGMLEGYPRSATAVVLEDGTEVQVVTAETFSSYFQNNPEKVYAIMTQMSRRIRKLSDDYLEACRAVAETVEAEKAGTEKSGWLKKNLKKFCDAYDESVRLSIQYGQDPYRGFHESLWY